MENLIDSFLHLKWLAAVFTSLFRIILVIACLFIATSLIRKLINKLKLYLQSQSSIEGEPPSESNKRIETLINLSRKALLIFLWITGILIIFNEIGINIGPIIASAGIAGIAIGFGAQNIVRDLISGFFIIFENQIRVDDVAIINGKGGLVEKINFRTIILRDQSGTVHIFPAGSITSLSNLTYKWSAYVFEIGISYKEDVDKVIEVMKSVGSALKKDAYYGNFIIEEIEIFGVEKFESSAVNIKGRIKTIPIKQWEIGREFLRRIKYAFDINNIEIPFPHSTISFANENKSLKSELINHFNNDIQ
jgi:small conductance mechanosensitive channel